MFDKILKVLRAAKISPSVEAQAQKDIAAALCAAAIPFEREASLGAGNRPDFLCDGYVIEVKVGGSKKNHYRQVCRYAEFDEVKGVILATSRIINLPETINGKPCHVFSISMGWLGG